MKNVRETREAVGDFIRVEKRLDNNHVSVHYELNGTDQRPTEPSRRNFIRAAVIALTLGIVRLP